MTAVDLLPGANLVPPPVLVVILALILDMLCGELRWLRSHLWHPVVIIGRLIGFFDKRLNRLSRSPLNRTIRGLIVVIIIVGLGAMAGYFLQKILHSLPFGWVAEAFVASILLAGRSLYQHVTRVKKKLTRSGLEAGREAVSHIVGRNTKQMDSHAIIRASIESLAENFADALLAPVFWFLILGLPGLFAYKALNTLDSMIGYRTPRHQAFGMTAARLDDAVNWIPARLTGLLLVLASFFTPAANPFRAMKIMCRDAGKHASPNAGWPEGAMAGAFDFALGGPRSYPGGGQEAAWIGSGRARLVARDIGKAGRLYLVANLILLLVLLIGAGDFFVSGSFSLAGLFR